VFERIASQTQELPGLLPPDVQDKEKHHYSGYRTGMGAMVDSYYEVIRQDAIGSEIGI